MQIFVKLRRIFDRATKVRLLILMIAICAAGFIELLVLSMITPFIAIVMEPGAVYNNSIITWIYSFLGFRSTNTFLAFLAIVLAVIYVIRGLYLFTLYRIKFRFLARRRAILSERLLGKIMGFSYLYHTEHDTAEKGRIISGDVGMLFAMVEGILYFLADFSMAFFIFIFLLITSPVTTLLMVGLASFCVLIYFTIFRRSIQKLSERSRDAGIVTSKAFYQAIGGIKDIKLLQREGYFKDAYKKGNDAHISASTQYQTLDLVPKFVIEIVCFGGAFIMLAIVLLRGTNLLGLLPQLGLFVMAAFRILPAIVRLSGHVNTFVFNRIAVEKVYESLFKQSDIATETPPLPENSIVPSSKDIIVQGVSFQYPRSTELVLNDVSLEIPYQKSVAFVGPSGEGKTTLADLILGVYSPNKGYIYYNNESIHHNFKKWSKNVGYVPQQIYLLDESIKSNIAFGLKNDEINHDSVWCALEQAQIKDFVLSLPGGLDHQIGERGARLSGGQRQRLGIARALYNDPPVLVLDEATSSLDNETEEAVMDAIRGLQGSKTIIIVAHRLSTIQHCDIVYRVHNKNVIREK